MTQKHQNITNTHPSKESAGVGEQVPHNFLNISPADKPNNKGIRFDSLSKELKEHWLKIFALQSYLQNNADISYQCSFKKIEETEFWQKYIWSKYGWRTE